MTAEFMEKIYSNMMLDEYCDNKKLYAEAETIETDIPYRIGLIFKLGIIQGQRMERARRKKRGVGA